MDTIPSVLHTAFLASVLLGADTTTAEAAVLDGIGACEDVSSAGLLIEAVKSTLRRRANCSGALDAVPLLPRELGYLLMLQPLPRDCFVLRILVGLSPAVCAGLLDISVTEFEDAVDAGLNQLPLLFSSNT
jgi:hypothetical protein